MGCYKNKRQKEKYLLATQQLSVFYNLFLIMESINTLELEALRDKYAQERDKRYHEDGLKQYIVDLGSSDKFSRYENDPWAHAPIPSPAQSQPSRPALQDGDSCTFLIIGAGYGGLLFAANLVKAGISPELIRFVDMARGFGGTWYWNRYPGLQCDVESYIYMPLLEETGYVPRHKYSFGPELREHAGRIACRFGLADKALFGARADALAWDDGAGEWVASLSLAHLAQAGDRQNITVHSKFVMTAYGIGHYPKLPDLPGLDVFPGPAFHTSRWDYAATGGSEACPELTGLAGKRVGIVGTGATAVQAIPHLARWAGELYVFQRTPSSIGPRGNRPTDTGRWAAEVATHEGWQTDRAENFNAFLGNDEPRPVRDLVDDEWTRLPSYSALIGSNNTLAANLGGHRDRAAGYITALETLDRPRQDLARGRVDDIVTDRATAEALKPWYPSWCKRPCFSDDYLQAFNRPNVYLVPTGARGVERIRGSSAVVGETEYPLHVLIFATGFRPPTSGSPAERSRMKVYGRRGRDMDDKWREEGVSTLHGMLSRDFPNFFFPGPNQMGAAPNGAYMRDMVGRHWAALIQLAATAAARDCIVLPASAGSAGSAKYGAYDFVVEPTAEAEQEWAERVAAHALSLSAMVTCTPNYMVTPEEQEAAARNRTEMRCKKTRGALWGKGVADYLDVLKQWRDAGTLQGLEVRSK